MGLRTFVSTEGAERIVAQRLKRMPRIVEKLTRDRRSNLSRMQDIGGCRAILPDVATVERVRRRIHKNKWEVVREDDYNENPKSTGYRGLHVVVMKHGRPIEIQLRTPWQHSWALSVEGIDLRRRYGLKDGNGPPELLKLLEASAYAIDKESHGESLTKEFDAEFERLADAARPYL
jgi:ppGpp synthetase/RelA/SpoT-type nucleotidyltranferase